MTTPERRHATLPPRRFNLGDMAILVVAAAIFLALARYAWRHPGPYVWTGQAPGPAPAFDEDFLATGLEILGTGLVVASFTSVALRLRRPRPGRRLLTRQPGAVAALAASIASSVVFAADRVIQGIARFEQSRIPPALGGSIWEDHLTAFPDGATLGGFVAVATAWLALLWGGRWRAERSWLDRAGRLVGWAWLVLLPLGQLAFRLMTMSA